MGDGEEAAEAQESVLQGIQTGWAELQAPDTPLRAKFFYIVSLPICVIYGITVPDCRPPGQEWKCFATFFMSIVGIGLSSKFMVDAAEELGAPYNLNIPIPWIIFLLFTGARGCEYGVELNKDDLVLPTLLLLIMVAVIIVTIAVSNWKMTHGLGYMMF